MDRRVVRWLVPGVLWGALAGACEAGASGAAPFHLVPAPREVRAGTGHARLSPRWSIATRGDSADAWAASLLRDEIAACYGWAPRLAGPGGPGPAIEIRARPSDPGAPRLDNEQGYRLSIGPARILIEAASAEGRYYGVQTLRQIVRGSPDGVLACATVTDGPVLEWRGISDDISRGQMSTVDDFKRIIRQLGYYKINLYQPYIEDAFAFVDRGRTLGRPGALTPAELAEIVAEGRRHHVAVCPIFESLAHQDRLLARGRWGGGSAARPASRTSIADLARAIAHRLVLAESADHGTPQAFSTRDPEAIGVVESLVDQIASPAAGPFLHIGGDEWDPEGLDEKVPGARRDADERYARYVETLSRHIQQRYARRTMIYADAALAHPGILSRLPTDVTLVDWHYDPADSFPSLALLMDAPGRSVIVSPALWTWRTFYPNYARGLDNVGGFIAAGKRARVLGSVTASWGDDGAENLRENNWLGYAYAAAASWERATPAVGPFLDRFVVTQYGTTSPALAEAERLIGWQEFDGVGWSGRLYHRPPLVRRRTEPWIARMQGLRRDMVKAQEDLSRARGEVRFDREHLDALELCASRYLYIADRELFLDRAARTLEADPAATRRGQGGAALASELEWLIARSTVLERRYASLWLARNRPEGLAENLSRMEGQPRMLARLLARARAGRLGADSTYSHMQALDPGD